MDHRASRRAQPLLGKKVFVTGKAYSILGDDAGQGAKWDALPAMGQRWATHQRISWRQGGLERAVHGDAGRALSGDRLNDIVRTTVQIHFRDIMRTRDAASMADAHSEIQPVLLDVLPENQFETIKIQEQSKLTRNGYRFANFPDKISSGGAGRGGPRVRHRTKAFARFHQTASGSPAVEGGGPATHRQGPANARRVGA